MVSNAKDGLSLIGEIVRRVRQRQRAQCRVGGIGPGGYQVNKLKLLYVRGFIDRDRPDRIIIDEKDTFSARITWPPIGVGVITSTL